MSPYTASDISSSKFLIAFATQQQRGLSVILLNPSNITSRFTPKGTIITLGVNPYLTSILAIGGISIVTANQGSGLYNMLTENNLGLVCPAEDLNALFETIEKALQNNYVYISVNARNYAEKYLSIDIVMRNYVKDVMQFDN